MSVRLEKADFQPRKGFLDVTIEFLETKVAEVAKLIYISIDLSRYFGFGKNDPTLNKVYFTAKEVKLAFAPGTLLSNASKFSDQFTQYIQEPSWPLAQKALYAANNLVNPLYDCCDLLALTGYIQKGAKMRTFSGFNGLSIVIGKARDSYLSLKKFAEIDNLDANPSAAQRKEKRQELDSTFLKLIKDVSYLALGILLVLSVFFKIAVPAIAFTALSANAVLFSFWSFYHDNLGKPKPIKVVS